MSPRPDTHDSSSSTSVVVAAPSPQKPAKRVVTGVAMVADAAAAAVVAVAVENPYLAGLGKKTRGLKKKLEKIKKTESLSASGKVHMNAVCSSTTRSCCFIIGVALRLFICMVGLGEVLGFVPYKKC